jgi:hypothetical protein
MDGRRFELVLAPFLTSGGALGSDIKVLQLIRQHTQSKLARVCVSAREQLAAKEQTWGI